MWWTLCGEDRAELGTRTQGKSIPTKWASSVSSTASLHHTSVLIEGNIGERGPVRVVLRPNTEADEAEEVVRSKGPGGGGETGREVAKELRKS